MFHASRVGAVKVISAVSPDTIGSATACIQKVQFASLSTHSCTLI